jgi:SAM-dependent methyltransferase
VRLLRQHLRGEHPVEQYEAATYGERIADVYDDTYSQWMLRRSSFSPLWLRGGRALELGIGTGRLAIPLAASGVVVHGIEISPAMVRRLREKPGGAAIPVHPVTSPTWTSAGCSP